MFQSYELRIRIKSLASPCLLPELLPFLNASAAISLGWSSNIKQLQYLFHTRISLISNLLMTPHPLLVLYYKYFTESFDWFKKLSFQNCQYNWPLQYTPPCPCTTVSMNDELHLPVIAQLSCTLAFPWKTANMTDLYTSVLHVLA